jgi:hypothetical protein
MKALKDRHKLDYNLNHCLAIDIDSFDNSEAIETNRHQKNELQKQLGILSIIFNERITKANKSWSNLNKTRLDSAFLIFPIHIQEPNIYILLFNTCTLRFWISSCKFLPKKVNVKIYIIVSNCLQSCKFIWRIQFFLHITQTEKRQMDKQTDGQADKKYLKLKLKSAFQNILKSRFFVDICCRIRI